MTLVLMLLVALYLLLLLGVWNSAQIVLRPPRMTSGKAFYLLKRVTPADLNLKFEPVNFQVRDAASGGRVKLAGWWMPHPAGGAKTAILVHGYADAKVGAIAWAPLWQQLGYNVLVYDQRAHGESEGRYCTGGVYEKEDISQVIDELQIQWPAQSQTIVLFGISLGAAPVLAVAADRSDLHAIVLECPFSNYFNAVEGLGRQLALPLRGLLPATLRLAAWISKADLHRVNNLPLIRGSRCPVFVIAASVDPYVTPTDAQAIQQAVENRGDSSRFWLVNASTHLRAIEVDPAAYQRALVDFLDSLSAGD